MNLFLNCVSNNGIIILFDKNRKIISEKRIEVLGNESEKLIGILDKFLKNNNQSYRELENIVVVSGPGSFTGIRTIVLMINTINFVINKNITSLNYFDLFESYPIIKSSSKRDSFFRKDKNSQIEIIKNEDVIDHLKQNNITKLYGENKNLLILSTEGFSPLNNIENTKNTDLNNIENTKNTDLNNTEKTENTGLNKTENIKIFENIDYYSIIKNIEFDNKKIIEPIYIKKPSIG